VFTHLELAGGEQAFVEASFMMQGNPLDISFRVLGTERSIEYCYQPTAFALHDIKTDAPAQAAPSLMLYEWNRPPEPLYTPKADSLEVAFREQVRYFAECVRSNTPPAVGTAEQARLALQIALASQGSCETGKALPLT
jgi:predicted dehydrogenase